MIELIDVSFQYVEDTPILKNINLEVTSGEFAFIVGSSGAGKSSLLKLLLREQIATSGEIVVNGYELNRLKRREVPKFRRSIGVVFQDFRLIPSMTVYDNIAFSLRVTNTPNKHIKQHVPYLLDLMGLSEKAKRLPNELSGGEQQRISLARALVNDPTLIIADEPTGNVDPELSFEIVDLLKEINRTGVTVLMVTHEHELVKHFGGRTISIEDGNVAFDGNVRQGNEG